MISNILCERNDFSFKSEGISLSTFILRFNDIIFVCFEMGIFWFIAVAFGFPGDYGKIQKT